MKSIIILMAMIFAINGYSKFDESVANNNYQDSLIENLVAKHFGNNLPDMRNELIFRKNNGEGFIERHYNAWTEPSNWNYQLYESRYSGYDFPDYGYNYGYA